MKDINKKNVDIFINGIHSAGNQSEKIEMYVKGNYRIKNNNYYLDYYEYDTEEDKNIKTTMKITDEKLVLIRNGYQQTHLVLQKDKNTQGIYGTPFGNIQIGVCNPSIINNLSENGGDINFKYNIEMNGSYISTNDMKLKIVLNN